MIDLEKDIEDNLNDISIEFVYLLRKNNLLFQFLKNYITNIICSKVDLTINIDELNEDFCRYDASELMERRSGADHLLTALKKYILSGNLVINLISQELASQY